MTPPPGTLHSQTGAIEPSSAIGPRTMARADWFRKALLDRGAKPCIPGSKLRDWPVEHDRRRYKRRHRIEMMFGRLKDGRRGATHYDRCPIVFLSAIALRGRSQRSGLGASAPRPHPGPRFRRPSKRLRL